MNFFPFWRQKLNSSKRQEYCTKAHKIFNRTAEDEDAQGSSFRKSLKTIQLMSDMNYTLSLLAMKKNDFSKAFLHARLLLKLGYRGWAAIESSHKNKISITTADGKQVVGDESLSDKDTDTDHNELALANKMSTLALSKPDKNKNASSSIVDSPPSSVPLLLYQNNIPLWSTSRRLFHALVHLSHLFAHWGLFPEARYYIGQALRIVDAVPQAQQSPCLKSQALACLGDYLVRNGGDVDQGMEMLNQAEDYLIMRRRRHDDDDDDDDDDGGEIRFEQRQRQRQEVDHHLVAVCLFKAKYFMLSLRHKKDKEKDKEKDIKAINDELGHASKILDQLLAPDPFGVVWNQQPISQPTSAQEDLSAEMMSKLSLQHNDTPSSSSSARQLQIQTKKAGRRGRVARSKNAAGTGKSSSSLLTTSTSGVKATTTTITTTTSNPRGASTTVSSASSSSSSSFTNGTSSILSRLKATILRNQASVATSMDNFDLAASLLSQAAAAATIIPGYPGIPPLDQDQDQDHHDYQEDVVLNKIAAGKLHLRQAVDAMAADPVFCVLPESTTSLPSVCSISSAVAVAGRGGRQGGASASDRSSPMKTKTKKVVRGGSPSRSVATAAVKGGVAAASSRDTTTRVAGAGHAVSQTGLRFAEFLAQAHEDILSVYEQAKLGCSTTVVHNMMDLLTRTNIMLSASAGSQAKAGAHSANSMFVLYVMGELDPEQNLGWP